MVHVGEEFAFCLVRRFGRVFCLEHFSFSAASFVDFNQQLPVALRGQRIGLLEAGRESRPFRAQDQGFQQGLVKIARALQQAHHHDQGHQAEDVRYDITGKEKMDARRYQREREKQVVGTDDRREDRYRARRHAAKHQRRGELQQDIAGRHENENRRRPSGARQQNANHERIAPQRSLLRQPRQVPVQDRQRQAQDTYDKHANKPGERRRRK